MPTSCWHCEKLLPINVANRRRERCLPQPASCRKRGEHSVCLQTYTAVRVIQLTAGTVRSYCPQSVLFCAARYAPTPSNAGMLENCQGNVRMFTGLTDILSNTYHSGSP